MTIFNDLFRNMQKQLSSPSTHAEAVTPSDTVDLSNGPTRGVYVGALGNLAVIMQDDSAAVTFVGIAAGTVLPIRVTRVMSTNTTATSIVALY